MGSLLDGRTMGWLFELFFKYPRVVFEQGDFAFAASRSMTLIVLGFAALAAAALITYRAVTNEGTARERLVLVAIRLGVLGPLNAYEPDRHRGRPHAT
jgi:hypothetical protein